jgi:Tfp pilus assembly protein PilF
MAEGTIEPQVGTTLAADALEALRRAATARATQPETTVEKRHIWRPDTWLIRRCWLTLAEAGAARQAADVARLAENRQPLAPIQALHRLAELVPQRPDLRPAVIGELRAMRAQLFAPRIGGDPEEQAERLILAAASAMLIGDGALALAYLERLDQHPRAWDQVFPNPKLRNRLAETVAGVGAHPLTVSLIRHAIRRFGDAGANFLQRVADEVGQRMAEDQAPPAVAKLLLRCIETVRYATLITMHSHRVATAILARGGLADEVMAHLTTIANIQEARRESGLALRRNDQALLRQVKRPQANADIDFQVYTLQEAIRAMPVRQITREQRIELSRQLAALGMGSDGWTAAGAASTLIELGALKFATDVVDHIAPNDPTRSEGAIALVSGLLDAGEAAMAARESQKALAWAKSFQGQNAERATIWGLAEVYLAHNMPDQALALLDERTGASGLFTWLRGIFQSTALNDDELRDNRLRLQALLQKDPQGADVDGLADQLRTWAPRLLEGEALIGFYLDGLVDPLLKAGRMDLVTVLLPQVQAALSANGGSKHAAHVDRLATLLTDQIHAGRIDSAFLQAIQAAMRALWREDAGYGLWQTVHGIGGSLPLLLALEGPDALATIARTAEMEGVGWGA